MKTVCAEFLSYEASVPAVLDDIAAGNILSRQTAVLIKPNLVNATPHPVTTPPACVEAVIKYVRSCTSADITIAEGCGDASRATDEIFDLLGYRDLADRTGVSLLDLNHLPLRRVRNPQCPVFPEMFLPEIAFTHFIISVPVLKAHSLADMTGTLKNMLGFAPPEHYSGRFGTWKKAAFHGKMQPSIIDLNRHRCPDLSLMDASIGLADYHLGGRRCEPPAAKLIAGFDPLSVDRLAAECLDLDWKQIGHLSSDAPYEPLFSL